MTDTPTIYEHLADAELFQLLTRDDAQAFTTLYRRHWEPLFLRAAKVLRSGEDAADVVQEVFSAVWRRRHEIQVTGSLAAYLMTSVKYSAIHFIEKNITRRDYLAWLTQIAEGGTAIDAGALVQVKEVKALIDNAVRQMPTKMQEVYRLSREEQLSHKEIAQRLQISPDTVKKHIQNALQLIRTAINESPVCLPALLGLLLFKK